MAKQVISVGDLVLDLILPVDLPVQADRHQEPDSRRLEPGGAGNFMIAARRMGLDVLASGIVGADLFGDYLVDLLRTERIDVSQVARVPGSTSTVVVVLTDQIKGEHVFVGCYGRGTEVPYPRRLDRRIAKADAVFIQGYSLSEARMVPMARHAVETASAEGTPIFLDVGPFMAHVAEEDVAFMLPRSEVILMTEEEVPFVSGGRSGQPAYDYLLEQGVKALVIKQGASGCTLVTLDEGTQTVPGFPARVVDTVGAGDCFDAAFTAGRLNGLSLWQACRLGNAMGAASVERVGAGRNVPTCDDVMVRLQQAGERINFTCSG